jgi:hypothetical protein
MGRESGAGAYLPLRDPFTAVFDRPARAADDLHAVILRHKIFDRLLEKSLRLAPGDETDLFRAGE